MRFPLSPVLCISCCLLVCFCCSLVDARSDAQTHSPSAATNSYPSDQSWESGDTVVIPGPLRSFLRMAGISQEISPDEVLPMLARNASLYGYIQGHETEYLVLVDRYLHLARDLHQLAGANETIQLSGCKDAGNLLNALGYRLQGNCGQAKSSLVTANAERAFVTIDSGFPITDLERQLQKDGPFQYRFPATRVPVYFTQRDWIAITTWKRKSNEDLLDVLLHDKNVDRLYAAMTRCDEGTRGALKRSPGLKRLLPSAAVLDLYGSQISIRSGRVIVPGGSEKPWAEVAGANPQAAGEFVMRLLTKDGGWLAAFYDAMARLGEAQVAPLVSGNRLKRFYNAYRSTALRSDASKGVYPKNGNLLILMASLKWNPDGDFAIPGGLDLWRAILSGMAKSRELRPWIGRDRSWSTSGQLLDALVASSNLESDSAPIPLFIFLGAVSTGRPPERQLTAETYKLMARRFEQFDRWFPMFVEFPALDDTAIVHFINAADRIDGLSNATLRANALGALQANLGLWQILARQGQIPAEQLNSSWQSVVQPFIGVDSSVQLFEATRTSLGSLLRAAAGTKDLSEDQIIELLAGPIRDDPESRRIHQQMAGKIRGVLDDQRLASLDTLFGLYDGLIEMSHGAQVGKSLIPLAEDLREFEMPRPIFTNDERTSWAPIVYTNRHAELQVRTDLTRILKSSPTPSQLETARGQLTPFLRDSLVGLNYAYYEPPGAQVLHHNPLFVRSHDFASISVLGDDESWGPPRLVGVGAMAGGGAYLLGSLADLPYALAATEEDFIVPKNVQALIWRAIVPNLLVDAVIPRWWNVSREELHFAALYQRAGEELLTASATNSDLQQKLEGILSDRIEPMRLSELEKGLQTAESAAAVASSMPPSDLLYLGIAFRTKYPDQASQWGKASRELEDLSRSHPADGSWERISSDFGVPHPALMLSDSCALLRMKSVGSYGGNFGVLFAQSWDSNNLYWARLADEKGYAPAALNLLVPKLTRDMVGNIFASNIEDWPALERAMKRTGEEFREGKITIQEATTIARQ
jgi:hypothetical protein